MNIPDLIPCILTAAHRKHRLYIAEKDRNYIVEDWKRVIWSDQTEINRLGSNGRNWAWKLPGEGLTDRSVEGTQKHGGGSVMVCGCMQDGWQDGWEPLQ